MGCGVSLIPNNVVGAVELWLRLASISHTFVLKKTAQFCDLIDNVGVTNSYLFDVDATT